VRSTAAPYTESRLTRSVANERVGFPVVEQYKFSQGTATFNIASYLGRYGRYRTGVMTENVNFKEFIIRKKLPNSVLEIRVNEDKKDTTIKKIQILCVFFKDLTSI
jgi:hypothetical protein